MNQTTTNPSIARACDRAGEMCELTQASAVAPLAPVLSVDRRTVAPGWVLVPVEPTQEMLRATTEYSASVPIANGLGYYRAMLAAAPLQGTWRVDVKQ